MAGARVHRRALRPNEREGRASLAQLGIFLARTMPMYPLRVLEKRCWKVAGWSGRELPLQRIRIVEDLARFFGGLIYKWATLFGRRRTPCSARVCYNQRRDRERSDFGHPRQPRLPPRMSAQEIVARCGIRVRAFVFAHEGDATMVTPTRPRLHYQTASLYTCTRYNGAAYTHRARGQVGTRKSL